MATSVAQKIVVKNQLESRASTEMRSRASVLRVEQVTESPTIFIINAIFCKPLLGSLSQIVVST